MLNLRTNAKEAISSRKMAQGKIRLEREGNGDIAIRYIEDGVLVLISLLLVENARRQCGRAMRAPQKIEPLKAFLLLVLAVRLEAVGE